MRDRRLVTKDHLQVTTHCRSCGHATDDITWPKTINDDNITRWKNLYHRWPTRATMVLSVKERTLIVKQSTAMGQVPCSMEHIFSCFFLNFWGGLSSPTALVEAVQVQEGCRSMRRPSCLQHSLTHLPLRCLATGQSFTCTEGRA